MLHLKLKFSVRLGGFRPGDSSEHAPRHSGPGCCLAGIEKGRTTSAPPLMLMVSALTNSFPPYSMRCATLVPQPVTITLSLVSRISSATESVYLFASLLTVITRVSLCVDIQTPVGLKIKA